MGAAILAGAGSAVAGIAWNTALQHGVPNAKLSRVTAFDDFGSFAAIPLGLVLAIPAADRLGFAPVETLGGVIWVLGALLPLAIGGIRQMTVAELQARAHGEDA